MKSASMVFMIVVFFTVTAAQAEINVNVSIGTPPPPRVIVSAPPSIRFDVAPLFIAPARLGFYVAVDTPYDLIFSSDYFYLYYGNSWHRSQHHNGPWAELPYREVPSAIRAHRIEQIRSYRDREYRIYDSNRDDYRGRFFRPDHDRKNEWQEERRHDREEYKEERQRDREEQKEEKRNRKHHEREQD